MKKVFTLLMLTLVSIGSAWADDVTLFTTDFSSSDWSAYTSSSPITAQNTVNGIYFNCADYVDNNALKFNGGGNASGARYCAIHVTGVNKSVKITLNYNAKARAKYRIVEETGHTSGMGSSTDPGANDDHNTIIDYNMTGSGNELTFYFYQQGSGVSNIVTSITITTPQASGKTDAGLTATPSSATLTIGGTQQITASATSDGAITYASSNTNVATVDASGKITAVAVGNTTITTSIEETATYDSDSKLTSVIVKPAEPVITKYATFDGSLVNSPANFATITEGGGGDTQYNAKFTGNYNGTDYTQGLKFQNGTTVSFTTKAVCDLVIVQSLWSTQLIKVDGTDFANDYSTKYYYDDAANNVRVYFVKGLAAGNHTITRNSEFGLFYLGVTEAETQVKTPVITPTNGSSFSGTSQSVTITCATEGATIHYTTDGTTPTASSAAYSGAFNITATTTVKAIAVHATLDDSEVATATITKTIAQVAESWDFTNWSDATKTDVLANTAKWNQYEKADNGGADFGDNGRSNVSALSNNTLTSTNIISEANGLKFTAGAYGIGLMFDFPSATVGGVACTYQGSQYIWLYNNNSKIIIPNVKKGSVIRIGVESHKNTDAGQARGITLNNATQTLGEATSKNYQDVEWTVTTAGDITITPSAGLHIYYITVTENIETVPVSKRSDRNYGSYVATKALDFTGLDMKAYIATGLADNKVTLQQVNKVPVATPIIVYTEEKTTTSVNVPVTAGETDNVDANMLVAGDGRAYNAGGNSYYYMAGDMFHLANADNLVAGKAYLEVASGPAPTLYIDFGGVTGIADVRSKMEDVRGEIFDLQGRKVAQPTKGLYIVNGKKVVIK